MSVEQEDWEWLRQWQRAVASSPLESETKFVLLALATYAHEGGDSYPPSQERLAQDCGVGLSTIRRALRQAHKRGFIEMTDSGPRIVARSAQDELD